MSLSKSILRNLKFAFVGLFALVLFAVPATTASATPKKAKYATIKIMTNPAGLLLMIDGKPRGETKTDYLAFDLDAGLHTVQVRLPNGKFWTREVELPAGRVKCVVVNYRPLPPVPASPCPFPVSISAPNQVTEGEIITYSADVAYSGNSALKYTWVVSPSSARVISGLGTSTLNVDSTGLGGQRIIATLTADDGSSDPACAQSAGSVDHRADQEDSDRCS